MLFLEYNSKCNQTEGGKPPNSAQIATPYKIDLKKYKIPIDKQESMWYNTKCKIRTAKYNKKSFKDRG